MVRTTLGAAVAATTLLMTSAVLALGAGPAYADAICVGFAAGQPDEDPFVAPVPVCADQVPYPTSDSKYGFADESWYVVVILRA